ncbi:ASCH domain-containing protein [Vibrio parahaemolyticus]|uniref:ASCH domain-containing protein n=1 Tax=Gammaproteobacteria TaxID=1236 RepID=UPI0011241CE6|nr:ASCH domain-containing protein [Vibrio parahaemolyticus]MDL2009235.1 ASCH domain-containing protein [Vibrio parahaemolyticus]TOB39334.1 RNA-binding protein [Vibrio parahaemolyticus]TOC16629.1 RNA-binding protein [Vibrio parahaemolyticus]TOE77876.1 RNA-binding protein [Vibrio parahaemolyticus]
MKVLHLPVKALYFRQMQTGEKKYEYRLQTDYWRKRLEGREYDEVHIKLGYPKSGDTEKILVRPWKGFEEMVITHPHFGEAPVSVFAIKVNE